MPVLVYTASFPGALGNAILCTSRGPAFFCSRPIYELLAMLRFRIETVALFSTHNPKKCKHLSASTRVWFEPVKAARIRRLRVSAQHCGRRIALAYGGVT